MSGLVRKVFGFFSKKEEPTKTSKTEVSRDNKVKAQILTELRARYREGVVDTKGTKAIILGWAGYGKTTLAQRLINPENTVLVEAHKLDKAYFDVETLIFDDINSEHVANWQAEIIFEYLTNGRHYGVANVILIAQHLKRVPRHLLDQCDLLIAFKAPKQPMKLLPHFEGLKEANEILNAITRLQKFQCIAFDFRDNTVSDVYTNNDIPIKQLLEKPLEGKPFNEVFKASKARRASNEDLNEEVKKTYVIAAFVAMNPHVKYSAVARKFGVDRNYVKQCAFRLKRGVIKLNGEQIEHIANKFD